MSFSVQDRPHKLGMLSTHIITIFLQSRNSNCQNEILSTARIAMILAMIEIF